MLPSVLDCRFGVAGGLIFVAGSGGTGAIAAGTGTAGRHATGTMCTAHDES